MAISVFKHKVLDLYVVVFCHKVTAEDGMTILDFDRAAHVFETHTPKFIMIDRNADFSEISFFDVLEYATNAQEANAYMRSEGYEFPREIPILENTDNQNLFLKLWLAVVDLLPHQMPRNTLYSDAEKMLADMQLPTSLAADLGTFSQFTQVFLEADQKAARG